MSLREDDVSDPYTFAERCRKNEARAAQDAAPALPAKPMAPPAAPTAAPQETPEEAAYKDALDHVELFLDFGELRKRDEGEREEARRWIEFLRNMDGARSDLVLIPKAGLNVLLEHIERLQAPQQKDNKRRDLFIAWLVAMLVKKYGLSPYRNRATQQRPSACSIAAEALSEHGMPLGQEAVEVIWRRFGPEPHA
jgi:hypothetical protein